MTRRGTQAAWYKEMHQKFGLDLLITGWCLEESVFECFGELKMTFKETNAMEIVLFPHLFLHMTYDFSIAILSESDLI